MTLLFDGWEGPARVVAVGVLAYAALIVILRLSGKRTLSKLSAFDFLVTVALGSTLATILLNASTPLAEGLAGLVLLVGLQFVISWASVRWGWLRDRVKSEPVLLMRQGVFLEEVLRAERVGRDDVLGAVRAAGVADTAKVLAVVLEPDGSMSVVEADEIPPRETSSLANVRGAYG